MSIYANINCTSSSMYCKSGCCTYYGGCADTPNYCVYQYTDFPNNTNKYYWPGYAAPICNDFSKNCSTGCCTLYGNCATSQQDCQSYYSDYFINMSKYYLPSSSLYSSSTYTTYTANGDLPAIIGGVAGGVIFLLVFILMVVCYKKKIAEATARATAELNNANNARGSTIVMNNNNIPQPVYTMNTVSPIFQPVSQPTFVQPYQSVYQPVYQPVIQNSYNQTFVQPAMGYGASMQGPIIY